MGGGLVIGAAEWLGPGLASGDATKRERALSSNGVHMGYFYRDVKGMWRQARWLQCRGGVKLLIRAKI